MAPPPQAELMPAALLRHQDALDAAMRERLADDRSPVYALVRYNMGWRDLEDRPASAARGKALRPALCLLSCEALCGEFERALPAAVSLELIHSFSLIHDDIQDGDEMRRHKPTVW